jgi:hypothetical protein
MVDMLAFGEIALIFSSSGPGEDQLDFGAPILPNGFKFYLGADNGGATTSGFWTASTSTVPEPASGTLLIAGLVGLAGLALKKSL